MGVSRYWVDGQLCKGMTFAQRVTPRDLAAMAKSVMAYRARPEGYSSDVPLHYFVATAEEESSHALNLHYQEPPGTDPPETFGVYQISASEAARYGVRPEQMYELGPATSVMVSLARLHLDQIAWACAAQGYRELPVPDLWAYLAIAHNQGIGTYALDGGGALGTIRRNGVDWAAYKIRNAHLGLPIITNGYGDSCLDGGERWAEVGDL